MTVASILKTFPRDIRFTVRHLNSLLKLRKIEKNGGSVGKLFDEYAIRNPEKIAIYFKDETWTFKEVFEMSNKIGNYFASNGIAKGDIVSLLMENRPEYICTWLGLSKIGAITALINFNLRYFPLKHAFQLADSKAIVCGGELASAVEEIYPKGSFKVPLYMLGRAKDEIDTAFSSSVQDLGKEIQRVSSDIPTEQENISFHDGLFLMYTSGTTGLPKSALIKHARFLMVGVAARNANSMEEDDIIYTTLPLYHTNAGILGVSQMLISGCTLALRHKFSAKHFWKDCIRYKATGAQYMGETCRYLLRQPFSPEENMHKVRIMFGNGLRTEIWEEFVKRFNISQICEIYGSTEGNASCVNYTNQVGACGFVPQFLKRVFPLHIAKLDKEGNPLRDEKTGLVKLCKPGETGELVCEIVQNHPFRDFRGYVGNKEANEHKILRNVLKKGDSAFRTGDLFLQDELGFLYFKDRLGDSFRWKGENVSATEVEYVISNLTPKRNDVIVFGVKVPLVDNQPGMAVIADEDNSIDLEDLSKGIKKVLPSYARPLFLRLVKEVEQTGTYKMKKTEYQKTAYDISKCTDVYFLRDGTYTPLTSDLYEKILSGKINL